MPRGHYRGGGGASLGRGLDRTAEEGVGDHGEKDVFVVTGPDLEHATGGIETKHGMLSLERDVRGFEIEVEGEAMCGLDVGKEGREANAVGNGEVIVDHGLLGVKVDTLGTEGDGILAVDLDGVTGGKDGYAGLSLFFVHLVEKGESELLILGFFEAFLGRIVVLDGSDQVVEYGGLVEGLVRIGAQTVRDTGEVEGGFLGRGTGAGGVFLISKGVPKRMKINKRGGMDQVGMRETRL